MTTFAVGEAVTFKRNIWNHSKSDHHHNMKGETYTILEVRDSPEELIRYDPETHDGGIGHHQLITLEVDGEKQVYSGLWFEEEEGWKIS